MTDPLPAALQLCPFSSYLETALAQRFEVIRWFTLSEPERSTWLAEKAPTVRAVITGGHVGCSNALMAALPALGIIAINGVGVDRVDLPFARSRGVRVGTTPGALTDDVADLAVGLIIGLLRAIPAADAYVRAGAWLKGDKPLARKVTGRRFGVVGLGHIGAALAARLTAFGEVAYTGPRPKSVPFAYHPDLLSLARACSVLILTLPASAATRHLVNDAVFDALGPEGYLINVARGSLVDEQALIAALRDGRLAGAALDVYEDEPNVPEALRQRPNVVLTPHMASATVETRTRMADVVLLNIDACLRGEPEPHLDYP
ncbi:MAG TPA: 2-hydroxyacid dehydrogenase [Steroidobacteraceae bacterium]|jgi:lactate dehydrogenase-like 2-hydroxyacid dehydrogenase|nr:2-hydroxyacid dehydrogenase [Steroidobacteraceae bacterium]